MGLGWRALRLRNERRKQLEARWFLDELEPKKTGLPTIIYIRPKFDDEIEHPHLWVMCNPGDDIPAPWFSITIEDEPDIIGRIPNIEESHLELVERFIQLNKDILLGYWHHDIDDIRDVWSRIQRVGA